MKLDSDTRPKSREKNTAKPMRDKGAILPMV
eukprot:CAMPEP_0183315220 /NCGR_PEP_ID=MMETSP0160_2-20130417/50999_1 /TAXON_ID=2839 ORGANISM="Odontella Sinensis, Strain Grunow 1884" /NCGR_SAMPLE_ID=MMETSP0160_2 /ASSEMBLY_ACC=CAM_ASM_000250 /LENGTH=30 /DNA_ID= /DNA_START= /DNA_END= /DNA_ORIENTATION=